MEQRRQEFAARGYYFRKLNQAYFAFTNLYAGAGGRPLRHQSHRPQGR